MGNSCVSRHKISLTPDLAPELDCLPGSDTETKCRFSVGIGRSSTLVEGADVSGRRADPYTQQASLGLARRAPIDKGPDFKLISCLRLLPDDVCSDLKPSQIPGRSPSASAANLGGHSHCCLDPCEP